MRGALKRQGKKYISQIFKHLLLLNPFLFSLALTS